VVFGAEFRRYHLAELGLSFIQTEGKKMNKWPENKGKNIL
jgi:hypothetical protein